MCSTTQHEVAARCACHPWMRNRAQVATITAVACRGPNRLQKVACLRYSPLVVRSGRRLLRFARRRDSDFFLGGPFPHRGEGRKPASCDGASCEPTVWAKSRSPLSLTLWAGSGCEATPSTSRPVLLRSLSASRDGNASGKLAKP
jgi:hypothetical protein